MRHCPFGSGTRDVNVDVAFGGAFYAIVDSEAVGIPIVPGRLPDLRRVGMEIKHAVEKAVKVEHPLEPQLRGIYGTIFTGPPSDEGADLRNVTIFADAEVDRSPCGTGTCAVMAVLSEMGLLGRDQVFTHESIIGTKFRGRVVDETSLSTPNSQLPTPNVLHAIIPEIEGEAYITGENTFIIDDRGSAAKRVSYLSRSTQRHRDTECSVSQTLRISVTLVSVVTTQSRARPSLDPNHPSSRRSSGRSGCPGIRRRRRRR